MSEKQQSEPPSRAPFHLFMIGQDSHGNWVVREHDGKRGGLFVSRAEALRYIRSENGSGPQPFVTIKGVLELGTARTSGAVRFAA
jgi:hypothetical protein